MPAPMMAPMPSEVRLTGPSTASVLAGHFVEQHLERFLCEELIS